MVSMKEDRWFDEQAVLSRVKNLWMQLLTCRFSWDLEPVKPYFSESLYRAEEDTLRLDREADRARYYGRPAVLDGSLEEGMADGEREILICRLFTRYEPRILSRSTDRILRQDRESFFHQEWTLVRPAGTRTPQPGAAFSVNCPNCGAPFSLYKSAKCPMCKSLIPVPDFTWTVEQIRESEG